MFFRKLNWNIVGWFRTVSTISYLIIALGLGAMVYHGFQGGQGFQPSHMLRLGLSFTGGTDITVKYAEPTTVDAVRAAALGFGITEPRITTAGTDGKGFVIETQTTLANDAQTPLYSALAKAASTSGAPQSVNIPASQIASVGPSLGREYLISAILALIIALGIQFLYIAFRFGWNYIFGLVTVVALVRDAFMMVGIYALADKRADDAFLAAVLTVIGYSVMDTIVILDRIRENTKLMAGQPYDVIVNESIKQTMTRSFNTLATVVITLVALLALGGASLQNFAFALLVGICSGGYHSIFFSAPLVLVFRKRQLEAAARRRHDAAEPGSRTRAVAGAASATRVGPPREDIVAARRDRRAKAKAARDVTPSSGVARYKRKRSDSAVAIAEEPYDAQTDIDIDMDPESIVDPLDAQTSGLHDEAYDQGHEEIVLNLEGFEPDEAHVHAQPAEAHPDEAHVAEPKQ
jgi:preprotein translocase subunit SecF